MGRFSEKRLWHSCDTVVASFCNSGSEIAPFSHWSLMVPKSVLIISATNIDPWILELWRCSMAIFNWIQKLLRKVEMERIWCSSCGFFRAILVIKRLLIVRWWQVLYNISCPILRWKCLLQVQNMFKSYSTKFKYFIALKCSSACYSIPLWRHFSAVWSSEVHLCMGSALCKCNKVQYFLVKFSK